MILKLKYFGMIAEATGKQSELIDITDNNLKDLDLLLKNTHPKIKNLAYKFAVNHKMAQLDCELNENDEIALLPPFAGG